MRKGVETLAMSTSRQYVYTASITTAGMLYRSTDYGVNWTNISTNILASRVGCDITGQYVISHHVGTGQPRLSTDYGATFATITAQGQNAGSNGTLRIYYKGIDRLNWYTFGSTGGNWTTLSAQGITTAFASYATINASATPTNVSGVKYVDTSTSGKRIMVVETIAAGNVYLCSDGMANAVNGQSYASNFVNLSSTLSIPQTAWKRVMSNANESFVFCNTNTVYVYEWSYAA
jgi:hypothetical protein